MSSPTTVVQVESAGDTLISIKRPFEVRFDAKWIKEGGMAAVTPRGWMVFCALKAFENADGHCWPSLLTLSGATGMSVSEVRRGVADLVEAAWISVTPGEGRVSSFYEVLRAAGGTLPVHRRQAACSPAAPKQHPKKNNSKEPQHDLPLFGPAPAQPNADAAAFLLRLGMDGRWVERVGHTWTLARCEEARDYAHVRAKKGGLLGYLRRTLELNHGLRQAPHLPQDEKQAPEVQGGDAASVALAQAMPDVASVMRDEAQERADHAAWCAENRKRILFAKG